MQIARATPVPATEVAAIPAPHGFWHAADRVAGFFVNVTIFGIGLFSPLLAYLWSIAVN